MNTADQLDKTTMTTHQHHECQPDDLKSAITESWSKIAPNWPLRGMVAANPLQGFENLAFEEALKQAHGYFQREDLPQAMHDINRATIKWLQVYTDEGQASFPIPLKDKGFLYSIRKLMAFDETIGANHKNHSAWLKNLPESPQDIIRECLFYLNIKTSQARDFLSLMLTTLPGWAGHIQYRCRFDNSTITREDYLAVRLMITCLVWPQAKHLLAWHASHAVDHNISEALALMSDRETHYKEQLIHQLKFHASEKPEAKPIQFVFCIDVRSEPFRRALEAQGKYETLGFAGFFGIPVSLTDEITQEAYASCPVLLKPAFTASIKPCHNFEEVSEGYGRMVKIKKLYQSLKYSFATPYPLAEILGPFAGIMILLKTSLSGFYDRIRLQWLKQNHQHTACSADVSELSLESQGAMAENALRLMGLTSQFSSLIVFCGHGSQTENNAYASALDCGACGGRSGGYNAQILADILNKETIRHMLNDKGIHIPANTHFMAAEHNTTTDKVVLFDEQAPAHVKELLVHAKADLSKAQQLNCQVRAASMNLASHESSYVDKLHSRACDWSQVRPEWGLAGNASFIVGPRTLTQDLDLGGRSFLHSYDWSQDQDGKHLEVILTAPMVVAQWINSQYLFSTWDNVSYGSGSKITQNITGKIGIMQGNASDLMHGLPLQSVNKDDKQAYHSAQRLISLIYAPIDLVTRVIERNDTIMRLFAHGWVHLTCLDPQTQTRHDLNRDLTWTSPCKQP